MKWIVALYVGSFVYAVVRYVAFAPENLGNLPVFVANKGVAMAAALCFFAGFVRQRRERRWSEAGAAAATGAGVLGGADSVTWFRAGVFGAIWHVPMALALLTPAYFKEFFEPAAEGATSVRMSFAGEVIICCGGLAAGLLYLLTRPQWTAMHRWWLSVAAMLMLLAHVLSMGYSRGLNISASHAYLPPMWLLSALGVLVGLVVLMMSRPREME